MNLIMNPERRRIALLFPVRISKNQKAVGISLSVVKITQSRVPNFLSATDGVGQEVEQNKW